MAATAAISLSSVRGGLPARCAATLSTNSRIGDGLQRLPTVERIAVVRGEESEIARQSRSVLSLIGAEKPRLIDKTGRSPMPVNSTVAAGSLSTKTPCATLCVLRHERQVAAILADQAER